MEGRAVSMIDDNRTVTRPPLPATNVQRVPATSMTALQERAEHLMVRALPQARYQLMRVGPAGLTGIGALLAAAVAALVLLLPAHQSVLALRNELIKAGHAAPALRPELSPQQFAASLPTREQVPALLGVVLAQATDAGVVFGAAWGKHQRLNILAKQFIHRP